MARTIFLLAALVVSISVAAQQPMSPNQAQGNPPAVINVNPPPTIVVAGSGLYGPSVFTAPVAGFATPQLPAGATSTGFVPGGAGASVNTPAYLGVTSTLGPAPLVYEGGQPGYAYAPSVAGAGVPAEASGRLINDMGPTSYAGTMAPGPTGEVVNLAPPPPPISLGEVAASYRAVAPHPINVYVNPAGQQLEPTLVVTGAAIASNVIPRTFIVAETQTAQPPQGQPPAEPQAQAPAPTQGQQATGTLPPQQVEPSAQAQQPAASAQAPTENQQQPTRLPATSTLLPLLGLVGLVSSGLALWLLRARR
jgi:hypothetical protein